MSSIRTRLAMTLLGFGGLAIATCLFAPLVGTSPISLARAFDRSIPFEQNVDAQIFFVARLPRVPSRISDACWTWSHSARWRTSCDSMA